MPDLSQWVVYCVGLYCFWKINDNLINSNHERDILRRKLKAKEEEAKAKEREEEEEEVRRMVRS